VGKKKRKRKESGVAASRSTTKLKTKKKLDMHIGRKGERERGSGFDKNCLGNELLQSIDALKFLYSLIQSSSSSSTTLCSGAP